LLASSGHRDQPESGTAAFGGRLLPTYLIATH
jgi:hypothetical protein